jgi:hypothetical protein
MYRQFCFRVWSYPEARDTASGATSAADPSLYTQSTTSAISYHVDHQHRSLITLIAYTTQSSQYNMSAKDVSHPSRSDPGSCKSRWAGCDAISGGERNVSAEKVSRLDVGGWQAGRAWWARWNG